MAIIQRIGKYRNPVTGGGIQPRIQTRTVFGDSGLVTAAQFLGGLIEADNDSGAATMTFPTAALVLAELKGESVGQYFCVTVVAKEADAAGTSDITITAGASAPITGSLVIGSGASGTFQFEIDSTTTLAGTRIA